MWLYAHIVVWSVPVASALYIVFSIGFGIRNRRAEREAGQWRRAGRW